MDKFWYWSLSLAGLLFAAILAYDLLHNGDTTIAFFKNLFQFTTTETSVLEAK